MKAYLVRFKHYYYYQGVINYTAHETMLVYAESFAIACVKISKKYVNADSFENLTIE